MPEADVFRAIADPTRRAVLELLRGGDQSVSEVMEPFRISQPAVSQHLRVLRDAGLVRVRNVGRERLYRHGCLVARLLGCSGTEQLSNPATTETYNRQPPYRWEPSDARRCAGRWACLP